MGLHLNVYGDEVIVAGANDNFLAKFMEGTKGNVNINTPFGKRDLKLVKKFKSKAKTSKQKS